MQRADFQDGVALMVAAQATWGVWAQRLTKMAGDEEDAGTRQCTDLAQVWSSSSSSCQTDLCNRQLVKGGARECTGALEGALISLTLAVHSQAGGVHVCFEGSHDAIKCNAKGAACSLAVTSCCWCLWRLWRSCVFGCSPQESGRGGMLGGGCSGPSKWLLSRGVCWRPVLRE